MGTTAEEFGGDLWGERMADLAERRERVYQRYLQQTEDARKALAWHLELLDKEHESLVGLKADRLVLVRKTAGPEVEKYHSADGPCGWVTGRGRSRSSFETRLEGEAKKMRLKRCTACRW
ncbi:hypothetical protein AB0E63_44750 [Kribbella sp. NPDC026596]|uniref:hypothetical protein n=1 Tax=Kribbella sp. NPDC026596 TaxID=3155122 RepID=UPI0033EAC4C1